MNTETQQHTSSSAKMLKAMVGIGTMCALLIVLTYEGTLSRVKQLKAEALEQAIFKVLPGVTTIQPFQLKADGQFAKIEKAEAGMQVVFAGYDDAGKWKGLAIAASGQGYADIIRILYGYDPQEEAIIGFYVLESKETPGLGDKIEKDESFLANFKRLTAKLKSDLSGLENPIIPVKSGTKEQDWEVDGITGATISSRAIANMLDASGNEILHLVQKQKAVFEKKN
ncbi:MAG: FMN-binding protein [Flammeovirgaceae bacterium]